MYNNFGKNEQNLIFLCAVVSSSDTKESMITAYQDKAGITPTFPIVLYSDGGKALADLFGMSNYGGPTWMCHPKLFFDTSSYEEAALTEDINAALNDDCVSSYIILNLDQNNKSSYYAKIFNNELILVSATQERVSIKLFSLNGKQVYNSKRNLSKGYNKMIIDKQDISKGMFILDVQGEAGLHYRSKVAFR